MAVSTVVIGGLSVGLVDLEEVFTEVKSLGVHEQDPLKDLILDRVKRRNYIPVRLEHAYREELYEEFLVFTGELPGRRCGPTAVEVRLYGASCSRCEQLDAMLKQIFSRHNLRLDYQYITDVRTIGRAGIMMTPALVVAGSVILAGRVPTEKQLETMLLEAITTQG